MLRQVGEDGVSRSGLEGDRNNFAPRAGASWDITGNGNWLARGGYGLFYDSGTLIENSALYFNPPYWTLSLWVPNPSPVTLANPFPAGRAIAPRAAINTLDPAIRTPYAQEATAGLEGAFKRLSIAAR